MNADKEGDFEVTDDSPETFADEDQEIDNLEGELDGIADDDVADDAAEDEGEAEEADPDAEEVTDAVITLPDGETMTVAEFEELRGNSLRAADYTRKTTEVAQEREAVAAEREVVNKRSAHLETAFQGLVTYLEGIVPPEPPLSLARTNANEYQYQQALRKQALAEIAPLLQMKEQSDANLAEVSEADMTALRSKEDAALIKAMPHLSDPIKRTAFDNTIKKTAEDFGFSEAEFSQTFDHRILQVLHYARMGKIADHNRRNAARRVETPRKGRSTPVKAVSNADSTKAMQRLSKSGSIEDALKVDF